MDLTKIQELSGDPVNRNFILKGHKQHFPFHFNLGMNPLKTIINACSVLFHDKDFYEKLDSNVNLGF